MSVTLDPKAEYHTIGSFRRGLKKLTKKYPSLPEDLEVLKKVLRVMPHPNEPISFEIKGSGTSYRFFKLKKFACRSIPNKGANTGLRLVFGVSPCNRNVFLTEIYHKSDQKDHDRKLLKDTAKSLEKGSFEPI